MTKNKMMRLASALLVAVLLTTCAISGTFAKYVTSANSTDSARVAKWGVEITANGQMFTTNEDGTVASVAAKTVLSSNGDNIVAPGMSGNLASVELDGQPEVAVEVKYEATLVLNYWTVSGVEYCPIVFTVGTETYATGDVTAIVPTNVCTDVADLIAKVEAAIEGYTAEYAAGQDLSDAAVVAPVVSWAWEFDGNDDVKDTALGDKADAGTAAEIALTIVTTVTQIN